MGLPEREIVVSGEVTSVEDGRVKIETEAFQGDNGIIRNGVAEVELR
jgi:hypothetical protein